jgi:hypothetical protein
MPNVAETKSIKYGSKNPKGIDHVIGLVHKVNQSHFTLLGEGGRGGIAPTHS